MHLSIVLVTVFTVKVRANLLQECAKLYNPGNYMGHLPSLKLPYLGDVPIPNNMPSIKPTPVAKTKAIKVVTTYVYRNPVCVKYSKKKGMCKQDNAIKHKGNYEQLVTKEYFVKDRNSRNEEVKNRHKRQFDDEDDENDDLKESGENRYQKPNIIRADHYYPDTNDLETSERHPALNENRKTPGLSAKHLENMLIEDRLDQLETILPHYTRRRTYETSTITVTKVLSNHRTMATLVVKNCIPFGFELCDPPAPARKRQSKVAKLSNKTNERYFFG
ncbi:unnamed protein product [Phyllotreta striolata]|uniref:Uncharacterized protein n=1 Tax=Phyllotreta striolata TaxID=444603 RepID=A0A9N9TCY8_PHYSR|nr:unnamed protein product [Phyllotreta striolata]